MALISIDIHVDRLGDVLAVFDKVEVHRSIAGVGGPFTEITDPLGPLSAVLDGTAEAGFTLDGLILEVTVDGGAAQQVTFSGTDPMDLATVLAQINADITGIVASEIPTDTGKIRFTADSNGTGSSIVVTAGAAATELGLSSDKANGHAGRIELTSPTVNYTFLDLDGDQSYFYQTRYSSSITGTVSSFSQPRQGSADTIIPAGQLALAKMYLSQGDGKPVPNRRIVFFPQHIYNPSGTDYYVLPGHDARTYATTNEQGYAQIFLLRGITYRVHFEGSNFMREFEVPDLTEFDLLPLIGTLPDAFDIVQAPPRPIKVTI